MTGAGGTGRPRGRRGWIYRVGVIWRLEAEQMARPAALAWAGALAALPALLLAGLRALSSAAVETPGLPDLWLYLLIPILLVPLGLLLTATSAIHSEIENGTWIYLALRPGVRGATLGGKYLFAVTWVFGIAAAAVLLATLALPGVVSAGTAVRTLLLAGLAALAYGALYLLLGVLFLRIGMVVAIAWTLVVEIVIGNAPAILNRVTVSHHLRSLFLGLLPEGTLPDPLVTPFLAGVGPLPLHLAVLALVAGVCLAAAGFLLRVREIAAGGEDP